MLPQQRLQSRPENGFGGVQASGDAHRACGFVAKLTEGFDLRVNVFEMWSDRGEQPLTRARGRNTSRGAGQQSQAHAGFEAADRMAQRGLGHSELRCSFREALFTGHGEEGHDVVQIFPGHGEPRVGLGNPHHRIDEYPLTSPCGLSHLIGGAPQLLPYRHEKPPPRHYCPSLTLIGAHSLIAFAASNADKPQLTVMRAGVRPVIEGPAANFTGKATIDRQVRPDASQRIMGSLVSFEPGARTAWHTHPLGQTLIVTSGCGWVQSRRWQEGRDPRRRRDLDARERQALAWRAAECGDVPLRHCRTAEWQQRGMDGKGLPTSSTPATKPTPATLPRHERVKFETPATANPIDQMKVVGQPTSRIEGPLKVTGKATYAYEWHEEVPKRLYGFVSRLRHRQGSHHLDRRPWRQDRAGGHRRHHGERSRSAAAVPAQHRQTTGRPRDPALPPGDRHRGRRNLRAGAHRVSTRRT